jgi:DNA damage-inducible protein 1
VLKRHQCCINLKTNKLEIGTTGEAVPFLGEADIPKSIVAPSADGDADEDAELAKALNESAKAAPPSAAAAPPSPAPAHAAAGSDGVAQLTALGFSREQAVEALRTCGGNVEQAAGLLLGGFD